MLLAIKRIEKMGLPDDKYNRNLEVNIPAAKKERIQWNEKGNTLTAKKIIFIYGSGLEEACKDFGHKKTPAK
jgi:hypothetical protein